MLTVITCDNCNKSGSLPIKFAWNRHVRQCTSCHHNTYSEWTYYFCDIECFNEWWKRENILELGFLCRDCRETGFAFGFRSNGVCDTCKGNKRIEV